MDTKKSTMVDNINYFSKEIHPCFENMKPNSTYERTWGETVFESRNQFDKEVYKLSYILNNFGHRCDDFKTDHDGKHILFAGCSFTFGEGMPYLQNWSGKLYSKLSKKYNLDGYYSLGFQNGVTPVIINNIIKYCNKFGNPELIICLFPDSVRKIDYENDNLVIKYTHDNYHKALGRLSMYQSILLLENFCKAKRIKLIWSTWDQSDLDFFSNLDFNNFIKIEEKDIYENATNSDESNNVFYQIARDGAHPGLIYSDGMSNILLRHVDRLYKRRSLFKPNRFIY